jgi:hypothetical protein
MRRAIVLTGAGFVFLSTFALGTAGLAATTASPDSAAASTPPPGGPAWCGFKEKVGSRVRCGYSSEGKCKQAIGEPGAICIVDPYLTEDDRRGMVNG